MSSITMITNSSTCRLGFNVYHCVLSMPKHIEIFITGWKRSEVQRWTINNYYTSYWILCDMLIPLKVINTMIFVLQMYYWLPMYLNVGADLLTIVVCYCTLVSLFTNCFYWTTRWWMILGVFYIRFKHCVWTTQMLLKTSEIPLFTVGIVRCPVESLSIFCLI